MTATRGAGLLRFTVARAGHCSLRFDANHAYTRRHSARLSIGAGDLRATMTAGTVSDEGAYTIHSVSRVTVDGAPRAIADVAGGMAVLPLELRHGGVVEVRTGLSTVDASAAAVVRDTEFADRPFAAVLGVTRARWQHELSRLDARGSDKARAVLYLAADGSARISSP